MAPQHRFSHFPALGVPKGRPGPAPCPCAPGRGEPWQEEGLSVLGSFQEKLGGTGRNGESFCPGDGSGSAPQPPVQWPGWSRLATQSLNQQRYPECACTPTIAKEQETWHKYSSRLIYMRLQKAQLQPPAGGCYLRRSASCLTQAPAGLAQRENPEVGGGGCPSPPSAGVTPPGTPTPPRELGKRGQSWAEAAPIASASGAVRPDPCCRGTAATPCRHPGHGRGGFRVTRGARQLSHPRACRGMLWVFSPPALGETGG